MTVFATLFILSGSVNTYCLPCSQIIAILWTKITDGMFSPKFHGKYKFYGEIAVGNSRDSC